MAPGCLDKGFVGTGAGQRPASLRLRLRRRPVPVLYLFHGTSGGADDWLQSGNAAAITIGYPVIVVMPDAGYHSDGGSWFTNWVDQRTQLGTADWETFHVDQLLPWIDANLRTVASRAGRAVAGLSQGGFGSFSYAARHPDLFASAASFSGAPDIDRNPAVKAGATAIIAGTAVGLDGVEPDAMFGNPVTDDINWQGHNPAHLVTNMAYTTLDLWTGNGEPGPYDTPGPGTPAASGIEAGVRQSTLSFAQAARASGIAYRLDDYGPGTHSWPYWQRDLTQYLPLLMDTFDHPAPAPAAISYRSIDLTWTQWGWTVVNHRAAAQAWSALEAASRLGFTFAGTVATVSTPSFYRPGALYRVTFVPTGEVETLTAGPAGQVTIDLTGPGAVTIEGP